MAVFSCSKYNCTVREGYIFHLLELFSFHPGIFTILWIYSYMDSYGSYTCSDLSPRFYCRWGILIQMLSSILHRFFGLRSLWMYALPAYWIPYVPLHYLFCICVLPCLLLYFSSFFICLGRKPRIYLAPLSICQRASLAVRKSRRSTLLPQKLWAWWYSWSSQISISNVRKKCIS